MTYNKEFFDREIDRHGTACVKWDVVEKKLGHAVNPMWVADMDFEGPEEITRALCERAAHPLYGYTEETEESVEALTAFMKRRHGVALKPEEHLLLPCVITGLRAAVQYMTKPGDGVIVQPPVYGPFYMSIRENERKIIECPLKCDDAGRYTMDLASIEEACKAGAKMMMLCNPHNPVSRCWSREELTALLEVLNRYQVILVSDEIHEDFVFEKGAFVPALTLPGACPERVIALTSASKTFNLAGLQQAVLFCRDTALVKKLGEYLHSIGVVQGNIFAMVATEAAYRYGDAWLDGMLAYVKEGEAIFREELKARLPEAVFSPLEATYLGWINLRAYGFTTEQMLQRCRDAGVEFTPGTFFGPEAGEGFLRINFACPHAHVRMAAQQLEKAIKG